MDLGFDSLLFVCLFSSQERKEKRKEKKEEKMGGNETNFLTLKTIRL